MTCLGVLALGFGTACPKPPPPDPDAVVTGAQPLSLNQWHQDELDCTRGVRDCADWFRIDVPGEGHVEIVLVAAADTEPIPEFSLVFADGGGRLIERSISTGTPRLRLRKRVRGGRHTLAVSLLKDAVVTMGYELRASFAPKPVAVVPRFEQVTALVLEIERRANGGDAILIDKGHKAGLARGQKGRLLKNGERIAEIEILEVFPDGSRAAIVGVLSTTITPSTVAEVDVPF
jgi:hypothetical protein